MKDPSKDSNKSFPHEFQENVDKPKMDDLFSLDHHSLGDLSFDDPSLNKYAFNHFFQNPFFGMAIISGREPWIYYAINQKMAEINGIPIQAHLGKPIAEVFDNSTVLEFIKEGLRYVVQTKSKFEFESNAFNQKGELYYFKGYYFPIMNIHGDIVAIGGILKDISEQMFLSEKFRKTQEKYRIYVESAPEGIFIIDANGNYLDVNPAACKMTGYSKDELLKMSTADLVSPNSLPENSTQLMKLKEKGHIQAEILLRKKSQEDFYALLTAVSFSENQYIGFCTDITDRKKYDEGLQQRRKMEAIGQLAGGVAHDFNNILGSILGMAEILKDWNGLTSEYSEYVDFIIHDTKKAASLAEKLLTFGRKSHGDHIKINIHKIIQDTTIILNRSLEKKIEINLELHAQNAFIIGDPLQLENMFINMAINASQALPDGGTLLFSAENIVLNQEMCDKISWNLNPGNYILVSVEDDGEGIAESDLPRIFEPFFTTKDQGQGTGLGLSVVYGTIQDHNGAIHVQSKVGVGTHFDLYFPSVDLDEPEESEIEDALVVEPKRILLVDDEDSIRFAAGKNLKDWGHQVTTKDSGRDAIAFFQDKWRNIDLIILDMIMPEMNGIETLKVLRQIDPNCKVIIASGFIKISQYEALEELGVQGIIQKPYTKGKLQQKISHIFQ